MPSVPVLMLVGTRAQTALGLWQPWEGSKSPFCLRLGRVWIRVHHGGMALPLASQPLPSFSPHTEATLRAINMKSAARKAFGALSGVPARCLRRPDARTARRRARRQLGETERPRVHGPSHWMR